MIDPRIIGIWRINSTKSIDDNGNVLPPPYGPTPNGVVSFQPDGRIVNVICDGRAELPAGETR